MSNCMRRLVYGALASQSLVLAFGCAAPESVEQPLSTTEQAIVDGSDASVGELPWQAELTSTSGGHVCGGSLIASRWVLTAAHCVGDYGAYKVRLGAIDRGAIGGTLQTFLVSGAEMIYLHPAFSYSTGVNDIALLHLPTAASTNSNVNIIALSGVFDDVGTSAVASGWGHTSPTSGFPNRLRKATLPIVDDADCVSVMAGLPTPPQAHLGDSSLCAGVIGGVGACNGDSGGPLAVRGSDGTWRLAGVVSGGGDNCDQYTIFTRVRSFVPWIAQKTSQPARPCSGRTIPGSTDWQQFGTDGVYVNIDTSACGLTSAPLYFSTIGGDGGHWTARGASSIYDPTATGFTIYLNDPGITPELANQRRWHINWEAQTKGWKDANLCAGQTSPTNTTWQPYETYGIYLDVDTSTCGLSSVPRYITSLGGDTKHWQAVGATSVYSPKAGGFRVYVNRPGLTVADAKSWKWHVNWQAIPQGSAVCSGSTSSTATNWKQYFSDGIYTEVDTSGCALGQTPLVFTSLGGSTRHWEALGGTAIYLTTPNKFVVYVNYPGITVANAKSWNWRVNWKVRP
jgi:secreted trypsin-like serine protease